jgi:hypothetical protein
MVRKQSDVEKSLQRKGFVRSNGDHHFFHYYTTTGRKTRIFTKTSYGNREIGNSLLSMMSKQCGLSRADFDLLIDCPLDREAYELKLINQGRIRLNGMSP